jgi:hypothetical protein
MAKIKYDISDVDITAGGDFTPAPVGLYRAKIVEASAGESVKGQPMLTVVLELTHDAKGKKIKEKYGRVWHRVPLEHWEDTAGWTFRLKELLDALGLKLKGALDPDKLVDESLTVKLRSGKDLDDNYRPEVGKLMKVGDDGDADEPDEEQDDEDDDDDEEDDEEYTEESLGEMDDDDLLATAEEFDVAAPKGKMTSAKRKKLIVAILEAQEEAEDDDEEEEDDEDEEDEDQEDYSDWSRNQLIKEARSRGLKVKKSDDDDTIRGWLVAADSEDDEDEDEEDEEDEEQDYSSWDLDDLKAECKERGLKTSGGEGVLIKRLEKDDESKEDPF